MSPLPALAHCKSVHASWQAQGSRPFGVFGQAWSTLLVARRAAASSLRVELLLGGRYRDAEPAHRLPRIDAAPATPSVVFVQRATNPSCWKTKLRFLAGYMPRSRLLKTTAFLCSCLR